MSTVTTVTSKVPVTLEASLAAVTSTVPSPVPVNNPVVSIVAVPYTNVATLHVTVLSVAFSGATATFSCKIPPLTTVTAPPSPVTLMETTATLDEPLLPLLVEGAATPPVETDVPAVPPTTDSPTTLVPLIFIPTSIFVPTVFILELSPSMFAFLTVPVPPTVVLGAAVLTLVMVAPLPAVIVAPWAA